MHKSSDFKLLKDFLKVSHKVKPGYLAFMMIQSLFIALEGLFLVYVPKKIIDLLTEHHIGLGEFGIEILKISAIYAAIKLLNELIRKRSNISKIDFSNRAQKHISLKVMRLDYASLEDPEILDLKERATLPLEYGILNALLSNLQGVLESVFTILGIAALIFSFSPLLFCCVLALSIVSGLILVKEGRLSMDFLQNLVPINRRFNHYVNLFYDDSFSKDMRLTKLDDLAYEKIDNYEYALSLQMEKQNLLEGRYKSRAYIFTALAKLIVYVYSGLRLLGLTGAQISLGEFSVFVLANEKLSQSSTAMVNDVMGFFIFLKQVEPLVHFLTLEEAKNRGALQAQPFESLEFRDVDFSYPKTDIKVLDHVSFKINKGESIALVGRNNAGKSTVVKLISRLFQPDSGEILYNGVNIWDYEYGSYIAQLSHVFQDFQLFPFRIRDNILCKNNGDIFSEELNPQEEAATYKVLAKVGLDQKIKSLEHGLDTWINKHINNQATDLSGGEKQKLAIARALYKDSSMVILDEPTAALDPLAEARVYDDFSKLVENRTAIFISHRMSASRFCDRILVLEDKHITGDGSHDELVKTNALYRELFTAQAQYYNTDYV